MKCLRISSKARAHRPYLISDEDILNPPKINIGGRCYRQIPVKDTGSVSNSYPQSSDTSQFQDEEELDADGIVENSGWFRLEVLAPELLYKFVVGKKGETKMRLERETKTQISIPKPDNSAPIVIKGHERSSVISARTRIELLLETSRWKNPFTHFLSLKIAETNVVDGFKRFRNQVLEECKGDRGIDDSIFQQPEKLHLTLGTLVLLDDREVTEASKLLHQCRETFVAEIPPFRRDLVKEGKLSVYVQGLEVMNDDPNNVDVLYAKIFLTDESDRLQKIADQVVETFVSAGYMERQYDRVKLHCTVMNSIFRVDVTGMRMEPEKRRDQHGPNFKEKQDDEEERTPFDASQLLKKLGNFHFGNLTIQDLHISTRFTKEKDGYYRSAAKISF